MASKSQPTALPLVYRLAGLISRLIPEKVKRNAHRLPFVSGAVKRLLDRSAPAGLVEVTVLKGDLRGARLKLDLKTEREYWFGVYERQFMPAVYAVCAPGMVVYDLGANIGYTSLAFARVVGSGGKVFAFEPLPENVQRIEDQIRINNAGAAITLVPRAVSDHEGAEVFLVHQSNAMGKLVGSADRETIYADQLEVKSLRLDDFVYRDQNPPPALIKLDIEGGGVKALPGMERILSDHAPRMILELHGPEEQEVAWSMLVGRGYGFYKMQDGFPPVTALADLKQRWRQHIIAMPAGVTP